MSVLGVDVSHHQEDRARIDFARTRAAGYRFVILKATEGATYVDPTFAALRARARVAGLVTGAYHFARAGNVTAEADQFCRTVGSLSTGELAVLDWEVAAPDPVGWCLGWLGIVRDRLGVKPLIYMNQTSRDGFDWSPVVRGDFGLWLAKYDNSQAQPPGGHWPSVAMKQFTDIGLVPGISGGIDVDVFYGDMAALARYGKAAPSPQPSPPPSPLEDDDMKLNAYRVTGTTEVRAGGPGIWWQVPSPEILTAMQKNGTLGPVVDVPKTDFDAVRAVWLSAVVTTPLHSPSDTRGDWGLVDRLPAVDAALQTLLRRLPEPPSVQA